VAVEEPDFPATDNHDRISAALDAEIEHASTREKRKWPTSSTTHGMMWIDSSTRRCIPTGEEVWEVVASLRSDHAARVG